MILTLIQPHIENKIYSEVNVENLPTTENTKFSEH